MASYNRIVLMGNLTRDPELTYTPSNTAVCKFGVATNHKWKNKEGGTREDVCFVDCTLFGRAGETFKQYMGKGKPVLVEGRLTYSTWTSQDGTKRNKHEVIVDNFQFLPGGRGAGDGEQRAAAVAAPGGPVANDPIPPVGDDDVPF